MFDKLKSLSYGALEYGLTVLSKPMLKSSRTESTIDPTLQRMIDEEKVSVSSPEESRAGIDAPTPMSPIDTLNKVRKIPTE